MPNLPAAAQDETRGSLAEAIAEIRWELAEGPEQIMRDPGFKLLLGKLHSQLEDQYPFATELPTASIPEELSPNLVRMQFRKGKDEWPLVQVGPGIATLNDTTGYSWGTFQSRLSTLIEALHASYPSKVYPLKFVGYDLRYLNSFPVDAEGALEEQLDRLFHLKVSAPPAPVPREGIGTGDFVQSFGFSVAHIRSQLPGRALMSIRLAHQEGAGKPVFILELLAQARGKDVVQGPADTSGWYSRAHDVIKQWFDALRAGE